MPKNLNTYKGEIWFGKIKGEAFKNLQKKFSKKISKKNFQKKFSKIFKKKFSKKFSKNSSIRKNYLIFGK